MASELNCRTAYRGKWVVLGIQLSGGRGCASSLKVEISPKRFCPPLFLSDPLHSVPVAKAHSRIYFSSFFFLKKQTNKHTRNVMEV